MLRAFFPWRLDYIHTTVKEPDIQVKLHSNNLELVESAQIQRRGCRELEIIFHGQGRNLSEEACLHFQSLHNVTIRPRHAVAAESLG